MGLGFKVLGFGFRVLVIMHGILGFRFLVFRVQVFRVLLFGFRASSLGFKVFSFGFRT